MRYDNCKTFNELGPPPRPPIIMKKCNWFGEVETKESKLESELYQKESAEWSKAFERLEKEELKERLEKAERKIDLLVSNQKRICDLLKKRNTISIGGMTL